VLIAGPVSILDTAIDNAGFLSMHLLLLLPESTVFLVFFMQALCLSLPPSAWASC
jgi:hypothetical protein